MNTAPGLVTALADLMVWCRLAHEVLECSDDPSTGARRSIRQEILAMHRRHLQQLRRWVGARDTTGIRASQRASAWAEVKAAAHADDDRVSQAAFQLLARALAAAYDRAGARAWTHADAMQMIREQKKEIASAYAVLARPGGPALRPAELTPVLNPTHSLAS